MNIKKNSRCPICGDNPTITELRDELDALNVCDLGSRGRVVMIRIPRIIHDDLIMPTSTIDLGNLKAGSFIKQHGKDLFTVRLRVPGGRMNVGRLKRIAEVAEKYGGEFVHLSVRQSIELININFRHFDDVVAELGEADQKIDSCGARVRVSVACGGCEYNPNGLMDTQKSALEVDEKLFGTPTGHHKFKVAFVGCPFDCPKSATNDIGFQGATWLVLEWYEQKAVDLGRIRLGGIIIKEGMTSLLGHLRTRFPENIVNETIAPQLQVRGPQAARFEAGR